MPKGSPARRRPSKAAMQRRLAEIEQERQQPRQLSPALAKMIDEYHCRFLTEQQMNTVRPFLREVFTAFKDIEPVTARDYRTHLAALSRYALHRGKALTPGEVLTTEFIDEYTRVAMAGEDDKLRARRRSILLVLATHANPGPTVPAKLTPIPRSSVRPPYTPHELAVIVRVCTVQPTPRKEVDLCAVVGCGAGGGLDSVDQRGLHVEHVVDLGEDEGLVIHVQDPRPRIVPVRAPLEHLLRRAIAGRRGDELLIGVKPDRRNTAARAVENAALYNVPHIEPARLRSTWLADLMTDTVPIGVLLQAAGLKSARTLTDLLPHLGPWLAHKNLPAASLDVLRGGAR